MSLSGLFISSHLAHHHHHHHWAHFPMHSFVHTFTLVSNLLNSTILTFDSSSSAPFTFFFLPGYDSDSWIDSSLPVVWQMNEKRRMNAKFLLTSLRDQFKLFTIPLSIGLVYISYQKFRHLRNQNRFKQPITDPEPQLATGIEVRVFFQFSAKRLFALSNLAIFLRFSWVCSNFCRFDRVHEASDIFRRYTCRNFFVPPSMDHFAVPTIAKFTKPKFRTFERIVPSTSSFDEPWNRFIVRLPVEMTLW